ncbi:efflux RND transporter periplasmic adaptor subunit [Aureimonas populi]|uniref:Efflux RND transporter periplasmic adaptor subunit n=1 Tax=Aureimonas populi TaxID=1701758 RepID=A0ABW5CPM3_9HYPH|nr:efflux RND transporter periplasmic adaptor subunit [Aureimonas populi]
MSAFRPARLFAAALSLAFLAGCQEQEPAAQAQQAAPPPSPVGIVEVSLESIPVVSELPGRISPTRIAEVRPRVGGIVLERIFEQGIDVEEGDPLFRIDPVTFEVQVQAAEASVARAEAVLRQATQEAERTRTLVQRNTLGTANLETAEAAQAQAQADLASAQANLRTAQINLDYATVRAPISGRIGRALVTEGALVSATGTEALATIQQLDPVYADIQQPVAELLRLREALRTGALTEIEPDVAQVKLMLDDGSEHPHTGRLLFSEATVEPTSGQVTLRAEFPNPDGTLLPGMYVRVAVEQGVDQNAIAVPNQSLQRDTAGRALLYIVNAENVVEARPVMVAREVGNRSVISQGLSVGERVVADGFQKTGPGATVTPVPWEGGVGESASAPAEGGEQAPAAAPAEEAQPEEPAAEAETPPAEGESEAENTQGDAVPSPTPRAEAAQ